MVHKTKNLNGILLYLETDEKNIDKSLNDLITKIGEEKSIPYNDVYIKISPIVFEKFMNLIKNKNFMLKDIDILKTQIVLKF